jgi:hypothetical protein
MSALEVNEQIKALPPEEKAAVLDFIHKMEAVSGQAPTPELRSVDRTTLETTSEKIFDRYDDLFRKLAQ